tara:strand:- start:7 stop:594 length:588 start_codon:yes stop_codon:yes gene_type:complete
LIFKFNNFLQFLLLFFIFIIYSCQPVEISDKIVFNNNLLSKISINANQKIVNQLYEIKYVEPFIDHSLKNNPLLRINNWIDQNINIFGTQNILEINIIDASITRIEKESENNKKFTEKTHYYYEINYYIKYILYNDDGLILATTEVKSNRSTTSDKYISINEKERIIDTLILDSLIDLTSKSEETLLEHMYDYML